MTAPTHATATATEAAAARRARTFAESLEARVLAAVIAAGDDGLTAQEARIALGLPVEKLTSVAPRLSAMRKHKGWVELTGESRDGFQGYRATAAGRRQVKA